MNVFHNILCLFFCSATRYGIIEENQEKNQTFFLEGDNR